MSDNLPFEIQVEIVRRLPVKSLLQCRSVSKAWKSLIDSSPFIAGYNGRMQHLLVQYTCVDFKKKYVSIVDDDDFPKQKVSMNLPLLVKKLKSPGLTGSSHGLLCLNGSGDNPDTDMAVIWNVSIRKAVAVVISNVGFEIYETNLYETNLGFGVCRVTTDPKIIKITHFNGYANMRGISRDETVDPWQVQVFALSTWSWRSPYNNLPRKSIKFGHSTVVIDGFLYWLAIDRFTLTGAIAKCNLIISFDITSEEFREVGLPNSLAHQCSRNMKISKLRESLVVLEHGAEANNAIFSVWMMGDGVPQLFTKLFTFNVNAPHGATIRGFRKTGEPIIEIVEDHGISKLVVYEPHSKQIDNLGCDGLDFFCQVHPYMETLLLLDQPDRNIL
ncbi:putative F-box domain-containing protein [Helianthus annuus]|nr:putative F-box domain-containing protein [Helianthus annuus]